MSVKIIIMNIVRNVLKLALNAQKNVVNLLLN